MSRRFATHTDVSKWIGANVPDSTDAIFDAIWWCCYRSTQQLVDDTVKHISQALLDGTEPFTDQSVTDMLENWSNEAGDTGDLPDIDEAIEADLRDFLQVDK